MCKYNQKYNNCSIHSTYLLYEHSLLSYLLIFPQSLHFLNETSMKIEIMNVVDAHLISYERWPCSQKSSNILLSAPLLWTKSSLLTMPSLRWSFSKNSSPRFENYDVIYGDVRWCKVILGKQQEIKRYKTNMIIPWLKKWNKKIKKQK